MSSEFFRWTNVFGKCAFGFDIGRKITARYFVEIILNHPIYVILTEDTSKRFHSSDPVIWFIPLTIIEQKYTFKINIAAWWPKVKLTQSQWFRILFWTLTVFENPATHLSDTKRSSACSLREAFCSARMEIETNRDIFSNSGGDVQFCSNSGIFCRGLVAPFCFKCIFKSTVHTVQFVALTERDNTVLGNGKHYFLISSVVSLYWCDGLNCVCVCVCVTFRHK